MNSSQKPTKNTLALVDFRTVLQEELLRRCRANTRYSLRAYARSLGIEASALSQILNQKRPITEKMKIRLGSALGFNLQDIEKIPLTLNSKELKYAKFQQMALDTFAVISDWFHYAILELTYLEDFTPDTAWVSQRLGITKTEANIAIERLIRLGLLKVLPNGTWQDTSEDGRLTHLQQGMTSEGAKKYQMQLLELSKNSVQEVPLTERNHTSATFCFNPTDMKKAVTKITEFRRQFANEFQPQQKNKKPKEVYQIQISFFPLTKRNSL